LGLAACKDRMRIPLSKCNSSMRIVGVSAMIARLDRNQAMHVYRCSVLAVERFLWWLAGPYRVSPKSRLACFSWSSRTCRAVNPSCASNIPMLNGGVDWLTWISFVFPVSSRPGCRFSCEVSDLLEVVVDLVEAPVADVSFPGRGVVANCAASCDFPSCARSGKCHVWLVVRWLFRKSVRPSVRAYASRICILHMLGACASGALLGALLGASDYTSAWTVDQRFAAARLSTFTTLLMFL
jgi:hypothetical protein